MTGLIRPFGKRKSRFIHPDEARRRLDEIAVIYEPSEVTVEEAPAFNTIKVSGIRCYNSDGMEFEKHPVLYVEKDVPRHPDRKYRMTDPATGESYETTHACINFNTENAIRHFDLPDSFLPSYACQSAIIVALFQASVGKTPDGAFQVLDPGIERVLRQYIDLGDNCGWHNNNTIVDSIQTKIIHYPDLDELRLGPGTFNERRIRQGKYFEKMDTNDSSLEDALKDKAKSDFIKDLTGLRNPEIFIDIARYFGLEAVFLPPVSEMIYSTWIGKRAMNSTFAICAQKPLVDACAARGVSTKE